MMAQTTYKERVAKQFSKHAQHYDDIAQIQLEIGFDAVQQIHYNGGLALDIGSGTGRLTSLLCNHFDQVVGVDISPGMVSFAQQKYAQAKHLQFIHGDAEALPVDENSVDFVFSSMTLQWCNPLNKSLCEVMRVLRPGGQALLVIMGQNSMHELRSSWAEIDPHPRVNQFATPMHLLEQAREVGFTVYVEQKNYVSWHADISHLLNSIRQVGASSVSNNHPGQPLTRHRLMQLASVYSEKFASNGQLPLTYNLIYLTLTKDL